MFQNQETTENPNQIVSQKTSKSGTQNKCREKEPQSQTKRKPRTKVVTLAENQTGHRSIIARHGKPNATTAKERDISRKCAHQRP